jgi:hypothetical protein
MVDERHRWRAYKDFAIQRGHDDSQAANENSWPMAQYALLINGAAASALIVR